MSVLNNYVNQRISKDISEQASLDLLPRERYITVPFTLDAHCLLALHQKRFQTTVNSHSTDEPFGVSVATPLSL